MLLEAAQKFSRTSVKDEIGNWMNLIEQYEVKGFPITIPIEQAEVEYLTAYDAEQ